MTGISSELYQKSQGKASEPYYEDLYCHLFDELRLLDLLLLRELHLRQKNAVEATAVNGFFIPKEEVISLLNSGAAAPDFSGDPDIAAIDRLIAELKADIHRHLSGQGDNIVNFPILRLARIFSLNNFEAAVVVMAFAFETDKKYEKIHAYFNDDMTKKMPSVSTALDVLCRDNNSKLKEQRHFSPDSPLLYFDIIQFADDHSDSSFMTRRFRLEERIKRFITGDNGLHESLLNIAGLYSPCGEIRALNVRTALKEKIVHVLQDRINTRACRPVFWLFGKAKEEKKTAVTSVCEEVKLPLLRVDLEDVCLESEPRAVIKNIFREAALQSAVVFLEGGDRLYASDERSVSLRSALFRTLRQLSWITFIGAETLWMPDDTDVSYRWYPLEFKLPEYTVRKRIWSESLKGLGSISESDIEVLSGMFNFSEGRIESAASYARQQALNGDQITLDHIYKACRTQTGPGLNVFAAKVEPHYTWDDIVLPEDRKRHLMEIRSYIKHKHLVYFTWGFEKKLSLGRGLNILFSGVSGTGKTMAADIIANELCLDLYKIDLSQVVSKYIGETEKNLNRIFLAAEASSAILFFDEADALFGKRSEVKDSHDRYANIETGYLLQKMEEHEGMVILATNFRNNMDEAFARRLHFTVEFPFPDEKQRELIWRRMFSGNAPLSEDIDYAFLSGKFRLAGGNIKNVALNAAFYAAEEESAITMRHIILSVKRELQKIGKLCVKGDFGVYYELLEDGGKA